jgi:hypothetical protein
VSNRAVTSVCQVINAPVSVCSPPTAAEPGTPATGPVAVAAAEATAPAPAATPVVARALAFTGTAELPFLVFLGAALLALGLVAMLMASILRRRCYTARS